MKMMAIITLKTRLNKVNLFHSLSLKVRKILIKMRNQFGKKKIKRLMISQLIQVKL
jgi:hypothetical protein